MRLAVLGLAGLLCTAPLSGSSETKSGLVPHSWRPTNPSGLGGGLGYNEPRNWLFSGVAFPDRAEAV